MREGVVGAPIYHDGNAATLAKLGVPTFACTPDLFPDLMAAAIARQDVNTWAARNDIALTRSGRWTTGELPCKSL